MADFDVRICPSCTAVVVEDSVLSFDPDICPHCGADMSGNPTDEPEAA